MVTVKRDGGSFIFDADGIHSDSLSMWERALAGMWRFRARLEIPASHIRGAVLDPIAGKSMPGLLTPVLGGTSIPGKFAYGTFVQDGRRIFWDVRDPARAIRIDLNHEQYDELIVEVEDPTATIDMLTCNR